MSKQDRAWVVLIGNMQQNQSRIGPQVSMTQLFPVGMSLVEVGPQSLEWSLSLCKAFPVARMEIGF